MMQEIAKKFAKYIEKMEFEQAIKFLIAHGFLPEGASAETPETMEFLLKNVRFTSVRSTKHWFVRKPEGGFVHVGSHELVFEPQGDNPLEMHYDIRIIVFTPMDTLVELMLKQLEELDKEAERIREGERLTNAMIEREVWDTIRT